MDGWWLQTAEFLRPLYDLATDVVLASHVVHTDDTSVRVRDAQKKLKHTGRFWPYVGDALHPLVVFDYTPTHSRDGPAAFLKDYRGYLQADAFNGYDGLYLESQGRIVEVACWAHYPEYSFIWSFVPGLPRARCNSHQNGVTESR
jgi:hypothetical protein